MGNSILFLFSFLLSLWTAEAFTTNLQVQVLTGNCFQARPGEVGCSNPCLQDCICSNITSCCDTSWDDTCVWGLNIQACDLSCPLTDLPVLFIQERTPILNPDELAEVSVLYAGTPNLTALIETADDFSVPDESEGWEIFGLQIRGLSFENIATDGNTLIVDQLLDDSVYTGWNILVYRNGLSIPDIDQVVANISLVEPINLMGPNNPYFVLDPPITLDPGVYWVEVYPVLSNSFFEGNQTPPNGWAADIFVLETPGQANGQTLALRDISNLFRDAAVLSGDSWVPVSELATEPNSELEFRVFGQVRRPNPVDNSLTSGEIAGIVVAIVVASCLLCLVVILLVIVFKIKSRREQIHSEFHESSKNFITDYGNTPTTNSEGEKKKGKSSGVGMTWEIDPDEIRYGEVIGKGAYGIVYKGEWRATQVAIKKLSTDQLSEKESEAFLFEVNLMKNLRPHENVITLLGVITEPPSVVTLFMPGGNLYNYLRERPSISNSEKLEFTSGIAKGMLHLQLEKIVHRDLAARNILLDKNQVPKISDFGFSRFIGTEEGAKTENNVGPLKWMAPECLRDREYSSKSDVWAFGITVIEIYTQTIPYPNDNPVVVSSKVMSKKQNFHHDIPESIPQFLKELLLQCWMRSPSDRPDFQQIVNVLNTQKDE